jgi:hypothetical protein
MPVVTNLVIRPVDGHVLTVNGRRIPQPPWILPGDPESLIVYWAWIAMQARIEAIELGHDWILSQLDQTEARRMDEALLHLLNDFLFGQPNPVFEARDIA